MFVQRCVKGIRGRTATHPNGLNDAEAKALLTDGCGILSNWWRNNGSITPTGCLQKLTRVNLERHIHDYAAFEAETPFISLSAGCVERDDALRLNRIHEATDIALRFATNWGEVHGYLFRCWVVVAPRPAVPVQGVAEDVRNLHTYTRYSDYQREGEITAKINIPATQIESVERWDSNGRGRIARRPLWIHLNPHFQPPEVLSNIMEAI